MKILIIFFVFISACLCAVPEVPGIFDCTFRCINAKKPSAKPNYVAPVNGCGSQGIVANPKSLPNPQFVTCCNSHDTCYGTCNAVRETCDKQFRDCMMSSCTKLGCKVIAESFYGIVRGAGCPSYLAAQRNGCVCA